MTDSVEEETPSPVEADEADDPTTVKAESPTKTAGPTAGPKVAYDSFGEIGGSFKEPFPADRWTRAGASEGELATLEEAWDGMDDDQRSVQAGGIIRAADGELAQMLESQRDGDGVSGYEAPPAPEPDEPEVQQGAQENPIKTAGPVKRAKAADDEAEKPKAEKAPDTIKKAGKHAATEPGPPAGDEWTERAPLNVDGVWHKAWELPDGSLSVRIGDAETGEHLTGKTEGELVAKVRAITAET